MRGVGRPPKSDRTMVMLVDQSSPAQLPLYVADSPAELSRVLGLSRSTVSSAIIHDRQAGRTSKYEMVELTEEDWDWCHKDD